MPLFLRDFSATQMAALFCIGFVALAWIGVLACRPRAHGWIHGRRNANDMIGFTLASFSTLYGILLGLIAVEAYQDFAAVKDVLSKEALTLATLRHDIDGFPHPVQSALREQLRDFAREAVATVAAAGDQPGASAHTASPRLKSLFQTVLAFKPSTKSEELVQGESLRRLNMLVEYRRYLIAAGDDGLPPALWWVVIGGALLLILLMSLFDMEIHVHFILGGSLALFLGAAVFLIAALDNPFSGGLTVSVEPIASVLELVLKAE